MLCNRGCCEPLVTPVSQSSRCRSSRLLCTRNLQIPTRYRLTRKTARCSQTSVQCGRCLPQLQISRKCLPLLRLGLLCEQTSKVDKCEGVEFNLCKGVEFSLSEGWLISAKQEQNRTLKQPQSQASEEKEIP